MTTTSAHLDASRPARERADDLLAQMTLREKCFQITSAAPWNYVDAWGTRAPGVEEFLHRSPGFICNFGVDDPRVMGATVGAVQRMAVEETRLGIPLLFQAEALSGFLCGGHMVFPTPTGLAATWSPDLIGQMTDLIGRQMRRLGVHQALSPNLDIALDPRWGRVHETFGEDPYLVAALGTAFVHGLQSNDLTGGVAATAKHFIGYGAPEAGSNLSAFEAGPRRIRDLYAFPFEAAIHTAGLLSVMNSYSDVDGVPAAASQTVLTELLRGTLGFTGFVSADYNAIEQLVTRQRAAADFAEAGMLALQAGLDTEFPVPLGYGDTLLEQVETGRVAVEAVDAAVRHVLEAKVRLGLFENPYPAETIDVAAIAAEGSELSRELARRAVVLLRNDGALPIAHGASVAVVGPHADAVVEQFATYSYPAFRDMMQHMSGGGQGNMIGVDPAMAEWNRAVFASGSAAGYAREALGARSLGEAIGEHAGRVVVERGCGLVDELDPAALERAVRAAAAADVVVLAVGGASLWFNGARTEGEGSDSTDIALPAPQRRLADAVAATGTPMVAVSVQGRAYVLPDAVTQAAALLVTPYGGPFGADAIADVLFGAIEPTGRLPYSIPRNLGQVPVYHHQRNGTGFRKPLPPDVDRHYLDSPATPLFWFGEGSGYTSFELEHFACDRSMPVDGALTASVIVRNVGEREGTAVVQLFGSADSRGVTRPAQQLLGFHRLTLGAGEESTVTFDVSAAQVAHTMLDGTFGVEPGALRLWAAMDGSGSYAGAEVTITGGRRVITSADRVFFSTSRAG